MQVNAINSNVNSTNFGGVTKLVNVFKNGKSAQTKLVTYYSDKGKWLGAHLAEPNGDLKGIRFFSNGTCVNYETIHGAGNKGRYLALEYDEKFCKNGSKPVAFIFDLKKFKEHFEEMPTLKDVKKFISKIKKDTDTQQYDPIREYFDVKAKKVVDIFS